MISATYSWALAIGISMFLLTFLGLRLLLHRRRIASARRMLDNIDLSSTRLPSIDAISSGWTKWLADRLLASPYGVWLRKISNRAGIWESSQITNWLVRKLRILLGSLILLFILAQLSVLPITLLLLLPLAALVLPDLILLDRSRARLRRITNALPETIDLISMCVMAGIGFHAGLQRVATSGENPLSEEFSRVLSEMQLGQGRSQALLAMSERLQVPTLRDFVNAVLQVDRLGVPLAKVLEDQSLRMRTVRREQAREHAQKLPVKILAPIMLFLLPSIFIIVLGPALVTIMRSFS